MSLYFGTTEITKLRDLAPQSGLDITDLWFGSTNVYTVWQVYEGALPATLSANGDDMRQYQVYGNAGGVGDRTVQLFDPSAYTATGQYLTYAGGYYAGAAWRVSDYIPVTGGEVYTITSLAGEYPAYCWYNSNQEYISGARYDISGGFANRTITAPANAKYLRFSYVFDSSSASYNEDKCMVVEGSTASESYEPYGYKLDMGVKSGNLFEVESDMLLSSNWDENPKLYITVYFINFKLSNAVTQELKKGIHTCSIFEHFTDGYTPNLLVCAFVPTLTASVDESYRILTNQGKTFVKTFDFSEWQDIYLIIGYGNGFDTEEIKQSKINELFENWEISIVEGSTPPASYEPYSDTTTPIYIGYDPLEADEYVDYQAGKIYRMIDGTLTPTDPPVPLPALPTCEGTTIVDYAGSGTAPSSVYLKYKKGW